MRVRQTKIIRKQLVNTLKEKNWDKEVFGYGLGKDGNIYSLISASNQYITFINLQKEKQKEVYRFFKEVQETKEELKDILTEMLSSYEIKEENLRKEFQRLSKSMTQLKHNLSTCE